MARARFQHRVAGSSLTAVFTLIALAGTGALLAQTPTFPELTTKNPTGACLEPAPLPVLDAYSGPLKKTVGLFARTLERRSVHPQHYKPGVLLCSLELRDKFHLFLEDSVDPVLYLTAAFDAGIDQATDRNPSWGQGAEGYGKRFGANVADRVTSRFFKDFAYPALFAEDPRYYRLGHGPVRKRLRHAAMHLVVAHRSDGTHMFNYSEWLGTATAAAMSNAYRAEDERGLGATASRIGFTFGMDAGFDMLREFWPEISRKLKLPFRGEPKLREK